MESRALEEMPVLEEEFFIVQQKEAREALSSLLSFACILDQDCVNQREVQRKRSEAKMEIR
jgi:hypothetical protein